MCVDAAGHISLPALMECLKILGKASHQQEQVGDGVGGEVSAAWQEGRGRGSQSFTLQTALDSEPPHLCEWCLWARSPLVRSRGCRCLPSGCHAKVTAGMDALWLMQTSEMH